MKNILIINGHPVKDSFGQALAKAYHQGAEKSGTPINTLHLRELKFNPNLEYGYQQRMPQEPEIEHAIDLIRQANHLVWIYPMWWYGMPALMKGFIDRTFLPGIAFKSRPGKFPEKLLKGKTARIIITADTPRWYDRLVMRRPAINQLKRGTLEFCGIRPVKVSYISPIKTSEKTFRQWWLQKVEALGKEGS